VKKIEYDSLSCIRNSYYYNSCSICVDECPENVFSIFQNKIRVQPELCTLCSACLGGCPTEAITIANIEPNREALEFGLSEKRYLDCKEKKECLAKFDIYHFAIMALQSETAPICDLSLCSQCEIGDRFQSKIEKRIEEANRFLESIEATQRVEITYEQREEPKRRLFGKVLERFSIDEEDRKRIDTKLQRDPNWKKVYPLKHKLLLDSLDEVGILEQVEKLEIGEFQILNSVSINSNCNNCGDCIQFCPTDALFRSSDLLSIYINSNRCIGCGICLDICKVDGVEIRKEIESIELLKPTKLIQFEMGTCIECKTPFVRQDSSKEICDRCEGFTKEFGHIFQLARDID